jgi:ADP-ribose pyrophosphatase YjhB (NUDIX family)
MNTATTSETPLDLATELTLIADQLRALSNNGLHWSTDPYQIERYQKILGLAARLMGLVEARPLPDLERIFFDDLDIRTPFAVVDTAVFDDAGRMLLIRRADDHSWAMPGGACDVGEIPAVGGAREVWEETGYLVEITSLLGVWDSRRCGSRGSRHLYHLLFAGKVTGGAPTTSIETLEVRWFAQDEIVWDEIHPGHPARMRHAFAWQANPELPAYYDMENTE